MNLSVSSANFVPFYKITDFSSLNKPQKGYIITIGKGDTGPGCLLTEAGDGASITSRVTVPGEPPIIRGYSARGRPSIHAFCQRGGVLRVEMS